MPKNTAKIKFTAETGSFNEAIKKSNDEMAKLRAELKLNEAQSKATGATVESLEERHKLLSSQLAVSQDKTEALNQKINKAVELFGENSTEVTKLKTQLVNTQTAEEKIRQAIDAVNKELDEQKSAFQDNRTASEKLADTIEEQKTKLDELKSKYSNAILEHGKYSREARSLAKEIDSLSDELNTSQKRMDEVEAAADRLDNSMENVNEVSEKVSEGFTVMKGAMAELVADGISKVVEGFTEITSSAITAANDSEVAMNNFAAKTGSSTERVSELEEVMMSIYKNNYGESFEDIADAMASIDQQFGAFEMGAEGMEILTTKALILRDTFDMEVNESIRAANSLMDQFGIDGDYAYSLIAQGAQNGLNKNGDLLDVINEYSVQFATAGYDAEQMFNMLMNGASQGTWSVDKLGDAVKEFNIRASDGTISEAIKENAEAFGLTKTEAEALAAEIESGSVGSYQKLRDKLQEVDDDTTRYQLGVSMFGTMWEDLGENTVLALMDTQGELSMTNDALEQINDVKYDDLGSAFEGIKRNLQISVSEPIKNEVMPAVNEFVEDVDWDGVGQTIGEAFGEIIDGAFAIAGAVQESVQWMNEHKSVMIAVASVVGILTTAITAYNVVQGVKTAMDAAQVTTVWALVAAHLAQAAAAMAALAPYLLIVAAIAAVIAIGVSLYQNWDTIKEKCSELWSSLTEKFNAIKETVTGKITEMKESVSEKFESIKETAGTVMEAAKETVSEKLANMKAAYDEHGGGIKGVAAAAMEGVKGYYSAGYSFIDTLTGGKLSAVADKFKSKMSEAKQAVSDKISNIKSSFSDGLSNAFSTVSNKLGSIKEKFSSIMDGAKRIVSNAIDKIKGFFNFSWSLPKLKMPHVSITGKFSLSPPSVPKFGISWYKEGGIMMSPTIFGVNGNSLMAGGEAGPEAILPIDHLQGYIENAMDKAMNVVNLQSLADSIEELANRPVKVYLNDKEIAVATASASDSVNGLRSAFRSRGLALE